MDVRITRQPTPSDNESLPGILTNAAEIAVVQHSACRAYYKPTRAMIQGLTSARPFGVRSFSNFDSSVMFPFDADYSPGVGSGFLEFGTDDTPANNGNLYAGPNLVALDFQSGFTMGAVFRAPADGGGAIVGNMVNQQKVGENSANQRWAGIALGFGDTVDVGSLFAMFSGQALRVRTTGSHDWRDGNWHVAVSIFDYENQLLKVRVDGGLEGSIETQTGTGTPRDITVVGGGQQLRMGATGLPDGPTDYHFKGDIARTFVMASGSVSGSIITAWEASMIEQFGIVAQA